MFKAAGLISVMGGMGAVVLVILTNGAFSSPNDANLMYFLSALAQYPLLPTFVILVAFAGGALIEMLCAGLGLLVAALIVRNWRKYSPRLAATAGGVVAALTATLLSPLASSISAVPLDLTVAALAFFNLVTVTLVIRLRVEQGRLGLS